MKTKAGHLAELNNGVVQLNALKVCFDSLTDELQKAQQKVEQADQHIMQLLSNIYATKPGLESAKHKEVAQRYDLKYTRELVVTRMEWQRAQCSLDREGLWKQILTRKDLAPTLTGDDIVFISREEYMKYKNLLVSLYSEERESELYNETETLQFWSSIKMTDSPMRTCERSPKTRRTQQTSAPAENTSAEQPDIESGNGTPHYVCHCRPSSGCFCHLTAYKAKDQDRHGNY